MSTEREPPRAGAVARIAAAGALIAACLLVALVLFGSGSSYTLRADFTDASGLVTGNDVLIGPAKVGSVTSVGLTPDGLAQVTMNLDPDAAPVRQGTVARIYENSLSGLANRYVVLEPAPASAPAIPDGGLITSQYTHAMVSLDEVFDALDPLTRAGLRGVVRGEAASISGRARQANQTLAYLAPALASTSNVTAELSRDEPAFDDLLVEGAAAMQTLATQTQQLSALIANTSAATGALAGQSQSLEQALTLLPGTLARTTTTYAGLRTTLDALAPLVAAAKPAVRRLLPFAVALRSFARAAVPTVGALSTLLKNPSGRGDLTALLTAAPSLNTVSSSAFVHLIETMNDSQAQVDYLRDYTPDVVAALSDVGQASAYYDANGHYARTQPFFGAFGLDGANELTARPDFDRYAGLQVVHGRCPGGAVQPAPDGSAPVAVPGCQPSSVPPGP